MIKILYIVIAFLVVACSGANVSFETPPITTEYRAINSTAIPQTKTPIPTATIDFNATSQIALSQVAIALNQAATSQAEADAANRLVVEATSAHEQREHEIALSNAQGTQQAQSENMIVYGWTVTAAFTSIPLTQTQQSAINTQVPRQQALMSGALTATKEAPTQMVAMTNAENYSRYWMVDFILRMFVFVGMGVFLVGVGAFAFRQRKVQEQEQEVEEENVIDEIPQEPTETILRIETNHDTAFPMMSRMIVPCTPDQFTKLVEGVLTDGKTLGINQWEGAESVFTRDEFTPVRNWLLSNRLAQHSSGRGALMLTAEGESIFIEWLNSHTLPAAYKFENEVENDKTE